MSDKHDRAAELRAIADGRLMLNVRNGVTVSRSMLAMIADEFEAMSTALAAKDAELERRDMQLEASAKVALDLSAQLAEANKALEPFANAYGLDGSQRDKDPISGYWADVENEGPNAVTFGHFRAARRAREAQGG